MAEILEAGNVYFFYRPVVEETDPSGLIDVQEFHVVLGPRGRDAYRVLVIGQKRLPSLGDPEEDFYRKAWGFVAGIDPDAEAVLERLGPERYETATRGARRQPAARPAGEGRYGIVLLPGYSAFAYVLDRPERPGEVQDVLGIEAERLYVLAVKNPEASSPPGVGLDSERRAEYPADLQSRFRGRRFADADPPALLDHEGAEILLIGAREEVPEDLEIGSRGEPPEEAELFAALRAEERRPVEPLLSGEWG